MIGEQSIFSFDVLKELSLINSYPWIERGTLQDPVDIFDMSSSPKVTCHHLLQTFFYLFYSFLRIYIYLYILFHFHRGRGAGGCGGCFVFPLANDYPSHTLFRTVCFCPFCLSSDV